MRARMVHVAPLFVLSGLVALGCEAAWSRSLRVLFGATHQVAGVLLAVFMAGMALGASLGAWLADKLRAPLRAYALAEAVVGGWALASPALFNALAEPAARAALPVRALLAAALLAPPTVAMGTTLPVLCAALVPARGELRASLASLYTLNVAGGALGAALAGFVLLPRLGVRATLASLGALALVVAALALWRARTSLAAAPRDVAPPPSEEARVAPPPSPREAWLVVSLAAAVGVLSFALQVAWNRLFALLLGSAAYTFALVLCVILCALAAGGARARGEEPARGFWSAVSRRLLALAITGYLGVLVVHVAPYYLAAAARAGAHTLAARVGLVVALVALPSYQVGALFPALASRFPARGPGRAAGEASAAVTAGNVLGALGAGFGLVPRVGVAATLAGVCAAALVLACVAASRQGWDALRGTLLACALGAWLATVVHPRWDRVALSAGAFRAGVYRERTSAGEAPRAPGDDGRGCEPGARFARNRVLFYREGALATVAVLGHAGGPRCALYSLRINGKSEGSVLTAAPLAARVAPDAPVLPAGDYPTNVLLGALAELLAPDAGRGLLVGWGTGVTARAMLDAGARSLHAVEIEPAVLAAAEVFDPGALRDPRVSLRGDDARTALRAAPAGAYDALVSQPSNPWVTGAASLFSREYFDLARSRISPLGVMVAWVQLYETDREAVRSLVATFRAAFPDAHAFRPGARSRDLLLVGLRTDGATTAREALLARLRARYEADGGARALLTRAGYPSADALAACYLAGPADLARYAGDARVDDDDHGALEYRVADAMLAGRTSPLEAILAGL